MYEIKYKIEREDGEILTCDCCDSEVATHLFDAPYHWKGEGRGDKVRYCEVCSSTNISSIHGYYNQHREDHDILKAMAQRTNMILEAIKKIK